MAEEHLAFLCSRVEEQLTALCGDILMWTQR